MANSACLTRRTAAADVDVYVQLACALGEREGLIDDKFERFKTEIIVKRVLVYFDHAAARHKANSCDRLLAATRSPEL